MTLKSVDPWSEFLEPPRRRGEGLPSPLPPFLLDLILGHRKKHAQARANRKSERFARTPRGVLERLHLGSIWDLGMALLWSPPRFPSAKSIKIHKNLLKSTKIHKNLPKSTRIHQNLPESTRIQQNPQESTKIHQNP